VDNNIGSLYFPRDMPIPSQTPKNKPHIRKMKLIDTVAMLTGNQEHANQIYANLSPI
jgi:hypothetical protein